MIREDHPFFFLEGLFAKERATFNFSRYVYQADSLFDEREHISVRGDDLTPRWLETTIASLASDQELAMHSKVDVNGRTFHIPMIDLATAQLGRADIDRMRAFLPQRVFSTSAFYRSGRSFHVYATQLLRPGEWLEFMGRLLLINRPEGRQIVDTRWVGHRLIAGYCSLRFSNNSKQYLGLPQKVAIKSLTVEHLGDLAMVGGSGQ